MENKEFNKIARELFKQGLILRLSWDKFCEFKKECAKMFLQMPEFEVIKSDFNYTDVRAINY